VLLALKLDNVALIDALDLEFSPGLTVLTGETGAGKSLLLDSLEVLLGGGFPGACCAMVRTRPALKAGLPPMAGHHQGRHRQPWW